MDHDSEKETVYTSSNPTSPIESITTGSSSEQSNDEDEMESSQYPDDYDIDFSSGYEETVPLSPRSQLVLSKPPLSSTYFKLSATAVIKNTNTATAGSLKRKGRHTSPIDEIQFLSNPVEKARKMSSLHSIRHKAGIVISENQFRLTEEIPDEDKIKKMVEIQNRLVEEHKNLEAIIDANLSLECEDIFGLSLDEDEEEDRMMMIDDASSSISKKENDHERIVRGVLEITYKNPPQDDDGETDSMISMMPVELSHSTPRDCILILDTSGSMSGRPYSNMIKACTFFIKSLTHFDRVAIVGFNSKPFLVSNFRFMGETEAESMRKYIVESRLLYPNGGTDIGAGIAFAQKMIADRAYKGSRLNVILMTDGKNCTITSSPNTFLLPHVSKDPVIQLMSEIDYLSPHPIHCIGFGLEVDTEYLTRVSTISKGTLDIIGNDPASIGKTFASLSGILCGKQINNVRIEFAPTKDSGCEILTIDDTNGYPIQKAEMDNTWFVTIPTLYEGESKTLSFDLLVERRKLFSAAHGCFQAQKWYGSQYDINSSSNTAPQVHFSCESNGGGQEVDVMFVFVNAMIESPLEPEVGGIEKVGATSNGQQQQHQFSNFVTVPCSLFVHRKRCSHDHVETLTTKPHSLSLLRREAIRIEFLRTMNVVQHMMEKLSGQKKVEKQQTKDRITEIISLSTTFIKTEKEREIINSDPKTADEDEKFCQFFLEKLDNLMQSDPEAPIFSGKVRSLRTSVSTQRSADVSCPYATQSQVDASNRYDSQAEF
jgi:von Willebrand factor type A domain